MGRCHIDILPFCLCEISIILNLIIEGTFALFISAVKSEGTLSLFFFFGVVFYV